MNFSVWLASFVILTTVFLQANSHAIRSRSKREAYRLPAGAKEIMGKDIKTTFKCEDDGYYADLDNDTCKHDDDAIPCSASPMFFNLNERIGKDGPFLTDADIERAKAARPSYRA